MLCLFVFFDERTGGVYTSSNYQVFKLMAVSIGASALIAFEVSNSHIPSFTVANCRQLSCYELRKRGS